MQQPVNSSRLFLGSCLALIVTAMTFAIRARLEPAFAEEFGLSAEAIGYVFGPAFWGFTLAMVIGGPLVDVLGMKRIIWVAFFSHALGIFLMITATGYWSLYAAVLATGLGNGMVEAACNPMVASLYTTEKTKMLNRFHVWFPGGIVIGSLVAFVVIDSLQLNWQILVGILVLPLLAYGYLFYGQPMPKTERVALGVSTASMWKATASPLFILMILAMFLTAATELGTNQRIATLLSESGVSAILVLALTNGVMALGRGFAGPIVHRLSSSGMLLFSAVFSMLGLLALSYATGPMTYLAAIVFGIGICYFWPTMLGFVSEKIPASGAVGLSLMGGAGMLSVSIVLPVMGGVLDNATTGAETLRYMAVLPAVLIVVFAFLFLRFRK